MKNVRSCCELLKSIGRSPLVIEEQPFGYGSSHIRAGELFISYRSAKITPKKIGQFVAIWKRDGVDPIRPYDISDGLDFLVIGVSFEAHSGQFIFPITILIQRGIVAKDGRGGKLGIRVYPPWDRPTSPQAIRTQGWQLRYFVDASWSNKDRLERAQILYGQDRA